MGRISNAERRRREQTEKQNAQFVFGVMLAIAIFVFLNAPGMALFAIIASVFSLSLSTSQAWTFSLLLSLCIYGLLRIRNDNSAVGGKQYLIISGIVSISFLTFLHGFEASFAKRWTALYIKPSESNTQPPESNTQPLVASHSQSPIIEVKPASSDVPVVTSHLPEDEARSQNSFDSIPHRPKLSDGKPGTFDLTLPSLESEPPVIVATTPASSATAPPTATNGTTSAPLDTLQLPLQIAVQTPVPSANSASKDPQLLKALTDLAAHDAIMNAERRRFQTALNTINRNTNFKRSGVRPNSPAYYECLNASRDIQAVEAVAKDRISEAARLEATVRALGGDPAVVRPQIRPVDNSSAAPSARK